MNITNYIKKNWCLLKELLRKLGRWICTAWVRSHNEIPNQRYADILGMINCDQQSMDMDFGILLCWDLCCQNLLHKLPKNFNL